MSRAERRQERRPSVAAVFDDDQVDDALDLLALAELAWHDCYGEVTPPQVVVDDILTLSDGSLGQLIGAALLAITDRRDLKLAAEAKRRNT